jgi:hypothetical protein
MLVSMATFRGAITLFCLAIAGAQCSSAQGWTKDPTTWWPDPSTGLMWAGQIHGNPHPNPKDNKSYNMLGRSNGLTWQQATDYCASLQLGGFADWRLPTVDEMKAATVTRKTVGSPATYFPGENSAMRAMDAAVAAMPYDGLFFKAGEINTFDPSIMLWTSTQAQTDSGSAWIVDLGGGPPLDTAKITSAFMGA